MSRKKSHKICTVCNQRLLLKEFYVARNNPFAEKVDGHISVCKKCIDEVVAEDEFAGLQAVLRMINKPFLSKVYNGDHRAYIRTVNSLPNYRQQTYEDSDLFDEAKALIPKQEIELKELTPDELKAAQDFWGKNYNEEQYIFLTQEWLDFESRVTIDSKSMEIYVEEACKIRLQLREARATGKPTKDLLKNLDDVLKSAGLQPNQETAANGVEQETFGTLIKKFENEKPIPEPDESWKDVDGMGKLIRVWFTGMMHKSLGLDYKFQDEFEKEVEDNTIYPHGSEKP